MNKHFLICMIAASMVLAFLKPFAPTHHTQDAEDSWRDITQYVHYGPATNEDYEKIIIYHDDYARGGMYVGRVGVGDYSRKGYFGLLLGGMNPCTACETDVAIVRDMGNQIVIELRTQARQPLGGQALTPWGLFLEIPEVFSDRAIVIVKRFDEVTIPPLEREGSRLLHGLFEYLRIGAKQ